MSRSLEDTVWYRTRSLLRTFLTTEHTPSIRDPIKRNSMALFKKPQCKSTSKQVQRSSCFRTTRHCLVSCMLLCRAGMVIWKNSLRMKYSPYSFPPSLSDFSKLHVSDTKSDLLQCLEQPEQSQPPSTYDCEVLDRAAVIHCLPTSSVNSLTHSLLRLTS